MRALIQRVKKANVEVEGEVVSKINLGLLIFLGVEKEDTDEDLDYLEKKIRQLRIFPDDNDKLNLNIQDISGEVLVVSQFTLIANCQKGNRPSFDKALPPKEAEMFYNKFVQKLIAEDLTVKTGRFKRNMKVNLTNDGPVTIFLDSRKRI